MAAWVIMRDWLVIDCSVPDRIRFCPIKPSRRPSLGKIHEVATEGKPTFTDALQAFDRETEHRLADFEPLMCIAGATSGRTISLVRSNWTISRDGLDSIFNTRVRVINDVVAQAWAVQGGHARITSLRGMGSAPDFSSHGRMAMLFVGDGLGAALIDIDHDGAIRILETEAGHIDFAAIDAVELDLAKVAKGNKATASWEDMLTLGHDSDVWQKLPPERASDRTRIGASWFARFVQAVIQAQSAWDGVLLTGPSVDSLLRSGSSGFDGQFLQRRTFQRLLAQTPIWHIQQGDAVLAGGAALMAERAGKQLAA